MSSNYIHKEGYNPKIENPNDFFPTPIELCVKAVKDLLPDHTLRRGIRVLDAGAGTGGCRGARGNAIAGTQQRDVPRARDGRGPSPAGSV